MQTEKSSMSAPPLRLVSVPPRCGASHLDHPVGPSHPAQPVDAQIADQPAGPSHPDQPVGPQNRAQPAGPTHPSQPFGP